MWIIENGYVLIRISQDQYIDRNKIEKSFFKPECLDRLCEILDKGEPGVHKIGKLYDQHQEYQRDRQVPNI